MGMKIPSWIQKLCHDTAVQVIAAAIIAIVGGVFTYFLGWWPTIYQWLISKTTLPKWYLLIVFIVVSSTTTVLIKSFSSVKEDTKKLLAAWSNNDISIVSLLKDARTIAKRIGDKKFLEWADNELFGGYKSLAQDVLPKYRQAYGSPLIRDEFSGNWMPVHFKDEKTQEVLTYAPFSEDIGTIEGFLKSGDEIYRIHQYQKQEALKLLANDNAIDYRLLVNKAYTQKVVNTVRQEIYRWASELV